MTANPNLGKLVISKQNDLGVGKIVDSNREWAVIEYFDSPISEQRPRFEVPMGSVRKAQAHRQSRVYFLDSASGHWKMGRSQGHVEDEIFITLPNNEVARLPETEVFMRWNRPLEDPWEHLTARLSETPYFHSARHELRRHIVAQRALTRGLGGLVSSAIEMEGYQIEVIRRVLSDSVKRYLLADEVGLGKTIEAGVILRQFALDRACEESVRVLVIVPEGIERQWRSELRLRCGLEKFPYLQIDIISYGRVLRSDLGSLDFIVIDEAHRVIQGEIFDEIRRLTEPNLCPNLLLLSATPVLGNEAGFHAILHLLDPVLYPIEDVESFRTRVKKRQELADIFETFQPKTPPLFLESLAESLRTLFPSDSRLISLLAKLQPHLEDDEEADQETLSKLVNLVRTHISESYRLHRRILRNRRGRHTQNLVTGRKKLVGVPWENSGLGKVEVELERWRMAAVESLLHSDEPEVRKEELARVFEAFLDCAWGDVRALSKACRIRLGREEPRTLASGEFGPLLSQMRTEVLGSVSHFEGESEVLLRLVQLEGNVSTVHSEFFKRNFELIDELRKHFPAVVCFATSPVLADDFFKVARVRYPVGVARHNASDNLWIAQWQRGETSILVCDHEAEEGLNLHGRNACLLHLDFPFSPNRLEQRIGRLDRFGSGKSVFSYSLDRENAPLWSRWKRCLDLAWQVFSRSIASLQYLVDEEMLTLRSEILLNGESALDNAIARLTSDDGIEAEWRSIRNQDELDSLTEEETGPAFEIARSIRNYDENEAQAFEEALDYWLVDCLQFRKNLEEAPGSHVVQYEFRDTDRGAQTLVSLKDLERFFHDALFETSHRGHTRKASTYPISFSRFEAQRRSVGVARLGNEVVEAARRQMEWDDRGTSFAVWRQTKLAGEGGLYFRMDFILEGALPEDSGASLRRRMDEVFPPLMETVWLTDELQVPSEELISLVELRYSSEEDENIRPEHWSSVLSELRVLDWAALCKEVRQNAESALQEKWRVDDRVASAISELDAIAENAHEQARSRIDNINSKKKEIHRYLEMDLAKSSAEFDLLIQGIREPHFHLDACGVVMLSPKNFQEVVRA